MYLCLKNGQSLPINFPHKVPKITGIDLNLGSLYTCIDITESIQSHRIEKMRCEHPIEYVYMNVSEETAVMILRQKKPLQGTSICVWPHIYMGPL